jgi:hypothetical protein
MRGRVVRAAVTALALLVTPAAASAQQGTYEVYGVDNVYVRPKPQSWTTGTLYRVGPNVPGVEHIDVQEITPGGWAYGYVYGAFEGCGWVDRTYLRKVDDDNAKMCPTDDATRLPGPESMFSAWTAPENPDGKQYHTVDCAPSAGTPRGAYGNYRRGGFINKYGDLPVNHPVDWRYTTKDGVAAMVKDTSNGIGAPPWFFVPAACIAPGNPPSPAGPTPPAPTPPAPTPPADPGTTTPPPSSGTTRRVCWKTSKSAYCKKLRKTCKRKKSTSKRCRRALRGTRKG